jgi:hypothetical protein
VETASDAEAAHKGEEKDAWEKGEAAQLNGGDWDEKEAANPFSVCVRTASKECCVNQKGSLEGMGVNEGGPLGRVGVNEAWSSGDEGVNAGSVPPLDAAGEEDALNRGKGVLLLTARTGASGDGAGPGDENRKGEAHLAAQIEPDLAGAINPFFSSAEDAPVPKEINPFDSAFEDAHLPREINPFISGTEDAHLPKEANPFDSGPEDAQLPREINPFAFAEHKGVGRGCAPAVSAADALFAGACGIATIPGSCNPFSVAGGGSGGLLAGASRIPPGGKRLAGGERAVVNPFDDSDEAGAKFGGGKAGGPGGVLPSWAVGGASNPFD